MERKGDRRAYIPSHDCMIYQKLENKKKLLTRYLRRFKYNNTKSNLFPLLRYSIVSNEMKLFYVEFIIYSINRC